MVEGYDYYTPDDLEEQIEDQQEQNLEIQRDVYEDVSPTSPEKNDLFSLFWKVINLDDSSKVGNLDKNELGLLDISVRDCQEIALKAITLGHQGFAEFFASMAQITLTTSASKKGWLPELFVSQRKFATKLKGMPQTDKPQPEKKKGFLR